MNTKSKSLIYLNTCLALFVFFLSPSLSTAQDIKDMPTIAYVYPAGAQQGTSTNILIGGVNFEGAKSIEVSGNGVKAKIVNKSTFGKKNPYVVARNNLEKVLIKRKIIAKEAVEDKKIVFKVNYAKYPDLQKMFNKLGTAQKTNRFKRSTQSAFEQSIKVEIKVDKNAKQGKRTIKVISKDGTSNSMPFYIDNLPEYSERSIREKNKSIALEKEEGILPNEVLQSEASKTQAKQNPLVQEVQVPTIINGQVNLLETDIFKFKANEGERIVAFVRARGLIYYMADAVPGWFQAAISIKDSSGREIAYSDDFYQNPDPLLSFVAPTTDFYTLEIKDAIYRGRDDFVYRIYLGKLPFITRIYPLGGNCQDEKLSIYGFNLDRKDAQITQNLNYGYNDLKLAKDGEMQSAIRYQLSDLEQIDCSEKDLSSKLKAEDVAVGTSINSILKNKGDRHFYRFHSKKAQKLVAEVFARRLGSPIDTHIDIYSSRMTLIYSNDDYEDLSDGLNTHHADSKIIFNARENEIYYLALRDTQNNAGEEYAYKLNLYEQKADFQVKASPSTINVVKGKSTPFNIAVFRENAAEFPVEIRLKNAPKGLSLSGAKLEKNAENLMLVLHCDNSLKPSLHKIELEAVAFIGSEEITRKVIPCEDMLQAFYYPHLVPTSSQNVCVISPSSNKDYKDAEKVKAQKSEQVPDSIEIKLGQEQEVYIGSFKKDSKNLSITAQLRDSSKGITIEKSYRTNNDYYLRLKCNETIAKVGETANLIIDIYSKSGSKAKPTLKKIDTLKAIKYNIVD